ncbi:M23 family metallopeptidase [Ilumatobacter sp.]|uniref:M23 family metallopeptidase n=1 Tax=Ilumatobacter sp. TaxID=1967498 RepID=UPI003C48804D
MVVALIAGCSSTDSETAVTTSTTGVAGNGVMDGYASDVDALSPLVITTLAPDPIPFTGTDGKVHVAYELSVLNYSPREATVTRLQTLEGGPEGDVMAVVEGDALAERTMVLAGPAGGPIPAGATGVLIVDDVYDDLVDVPASFTHRLDAAFGPLAPEAEAQAGLFPGDPTSIIGGPVTTSAESPVVIGPPLEGADWLAGSGCCDMGTHRSVMLPIGGRVNGAERFAVDWFKVDMTLDPAAQADLAATGLSPTFRGDPTDNEDYLAYGERVLAVADGTVVAVVSDTADSAPGVLPTGLDIAGMSGNYVSIDIGDGVYAFSAHLSPGSPTVKVGDKVTRGQIIGAVGNTGNSAEVHLHFQLQRTPTQALGDNVPFEIDAFTFAGTFGLATGFAADPDAGARTDQAPLIWSVVDFPDAP